MPGSSTLVEAIVHMYRLYYIYRIINSQIVSKYFEVVLRDLVSKSRIREEILRVVTWPYLVYCVSAKWSVPDISISGLSTPPP